MSFTLITGGVRSGKSSYAKTKAEALSDSPVFIATAKSVDQDMEQRIRRHQAERAESNWKTHEEGVELSKLIVELPAQQVVVIDCLTLWVSNLFEQLDVDLLEVEDLISERANILAAQLNSYQGEAFVVTNEVGLGVHPHTELGAKFADCLGRTNQILAEQAKEVVFMVSGIPNGIKTCS